MARLMTFAFLFFGCSLMHSKHTNAAPVEDASSTRHGLIPQTRNIAQFKVMIECATSKSAWDYNYYGCYCGFGGKGNPVDDTDRCCHIHDYCYKAINDNKACSYPWQIYLDIYDRKGCTGCADSNNPCERAICECDGAAARCFVATEKSWDKNYEDWPQRNC